VHSHILPELKCAFHTRWTTVLIFSYTLFVFQGGGFRTRDRVQQESGNLSTVPGVGRDPGVIGGDQSSRATTTSAVRGGVPQMFHCCPDLAVSLQTSTLSLHLWYIWQQDCPVLVCELGSPTRRLHWKKCTKNAKRKIERKLCVIFYFVHLLILILRLSALINKPSRVLLIFLLGSYFGIIVYWLTALVWSVKLINIGPGEYLDGWPFLDR